MFGLVLSSVRHNRARYLATLVAILTGVAFYTATGFVSGRVIDSLEGDVDRHYGNVDVAIVSDPDAERAGDDISVSTDGDLKLSDASAKRLQTLQGVQGSAGVLTGRVAFLRKNGKPFATSATGRLAISDEQLDPLDYTDGRIPQRAGEIAIDRGLAEQYGLQVGDRPTIITLAGKSPATIVGVTRFGSTDALDQGGTVSISPANAFDWLNSGQREYDEFYLRGNDEAQLQREAAAVVPEAFKAQTGSAFRKDQRESVGAVGRYLKNTLQAFAILALLVGGFVIFNTFNVIVAQRLRELAVMAAIGATPKQLKRSLRLEGLVLGLIGSTLGVLAGIALTFAMIAALQAFGVELPGSGIAITGGTVVGGILIGTIITVLSVSIPARRAARTEPMEALRDAAAENAAPSRRRGIIAGLLLALGLLGLLAGPGAAAVGFGALAFVAGVLIGGPHLAALAARVSRPVLSRFGVEGRLASDNSARNPQRTATTANALLIGVFLVTFVLVAGTSVKDFAVGELNKLQGADYFMVSEGGSIDPTLAADLQTIDGVSKVAPFRTETVTLDGKSGRISSGDLATLEGIADLDVEQGSLDRLEPGQIALVNTSTGVAPKLGSTVRVADNNGQSVQLTVAAILKQSIDASQVGALVDRKTFDQLVGDVAPTVAFIDLADGAQTATRKAIEQRAELRPDITLQEGNALGRLVGSIFDFAINAVIGLLMMSVLIALIGIVNTLSLSILERRRELGLLRVIGMTDDRVRRMVRLESLLIAGLGTVAGILAGLVVGASLVLSIDRLTDADIGLSIPALELVGILLAGVLLGFLAALMPARRSTRLEVLDAIGTV